MINNINDINKRTGLVGIGPLPGLSPVAAFNGDAIQNLIETKGFLAFHVKHALDYRTDTKLIGKDLTNDTSRPFIYYDIRPLLVVPQQFSVNENLTIIQLNNTGTAVLNISGAYLDNPEDRVFLRPHDLIILNPDITELFEEVFEFNNEINTRLKYRAKSVDYMACQSQGRLEQGVDFDVTEIGEIQFLNKKWPKLGEVVSIVYEKQHVFIVNSMPHSLRIIPDNPQGHGALPRKARYAPQLVFLDRSTVRDTKDSIDFFNLPEIKDYQQWLP